MAVPEKDFQENHPVITAFHNIKLFADSPYPNKLQVTDANTGEVLPGVHTIDFHWEPTRVLTANLKVYLEQLDVNVKATITYTCPVCGTRYMTPQELIDIEKRFTKLSEKPLGDENSDKGHTTPPLEFKPL